MDPEIVKQQSGQFKSTPKKIQQWEGTGVHRLYNMEEVIHPQPQCAACLNIAGISYPNCGRRKDSAVYMRHLLWVKWLTHLPQGQHDCLVQHRIYKK